MRTLVVRSESHEYPSDVVTLVLKKRLFYRQAQHSIEYIYDTEPTSELLIDLKRRGVDLLTFVQRSFLRPGPNYSFPRENEVIALLKINSFNDWWRFQIGKKIRQRIRGAEKKGIKVKLVEADENFFRGARDIYNETPIRQGLRYTGYGLSLAAVREKFENLERSDILGAYFEGKLVGFIWIVYGDRVASIESFVSLIEHHNKAPNNILMAETVRRCSERGFHFLWYARMGYLQGLDSFRKHHGFVGSPNPRYFVPLTTKGVLAIKLRMHKGLEYSLSPRMVRTVLPVYSLASRLVPSSILQHITS
jgi:hypothetical protein